MTFSAAFSEQWFVNNTDTVDWDEVTLKMTIMVRSPDLTSEGEATEPVDTGYITLSELNEIGWQAAPNSSLTEGTQSVVASTDLSTGTVSISVPEDEGFEYQGPAVIMTSIVISIDAVDDNDQFVLLVLEPLNPTYLYGTADYPVILKNPAGGHLFSYIAQTYDGGAANSVKTYIGPAGLVGYGLSNNTYASTPDSDDLDIVGDLDLVARATCNDWSITTNQCFIAKRFVALNESFRFQIWNNKFMFLWSEDGSEDPPAIQQADGTVDLPFTDGETGWVRVTLDVDNGAGKWTVTFYTAPDSPTEPPLSAWTVNSTVTPTPLGTTSIYSGTSRVEFGSNAGGHSQIQGVLKRAIIRDGINGDIVCDADFDAQPKNTVAFTEPLIFLVLPLLKFLIC